jgi:hypothetical protein
MRPHRGALVDADPCASGRHRSCRRLTGHTSDNSSPPVPKFACDESALIGSAGWLLRAEVKRVPIPWITSRSRRNISRVEARDTGNEKAMAHGVTGIMDLFWLGQDVAG